MVVTHFSPRVTHLLMAAGAFLVLLVIALYIRDDVIRPYGGDVVVALFLYFLARGTLQWSRSVCVAGVFAFAVLVEVAQGGGLISLLGLEEEPLAELVLGTTFDPADILAYALGAAGATLLDRA